MKRIKRQFLIVVCSLILGSPIQISGFDRVSANGCSTKIYTNMDDFYKEKKRSIQLLALGDSNIYRGFSPITYWEDKKVTSYSLASASQPAWLSYYLLKDALAYQTPEVVVFEINELFASSTSQISRYCNAINTFHTDSARLRAIQDDTGGLNEEDKDILYENYTNQVYQQTISKIIPSQNIEKKNNKVPSHFKGYLYETTAIPFTGYESYMSRYDVTLGLDEKKVSYIDSIIELCKQKKIKLLFAKFPTRDWTTQKSNLAKEYAEKRGIPMLDMNVDVTPVDWMEDTKDAGFHMNDAGAIKCTKAVEEFIGKYSNIKPTKDPYAIQSYNQDWQRYIEKNKTG
ncbi:hypothetical protein [Amedibacillus sp. YH-ame10]